jgi:hypothetical protein
VTLLRLVRAAGVLTVLVGIVHVGVGVAEYEWPSFDALWFHGSGVAVMLIGALTLLSTSERAWSALAAVALAANVLGVCLGAAFGALSQWGAPQGPVLIGLFAVGVLWSIRTLRRA